MIDAVVLLEAFPQGFLQLFAQVGLVAELVHKGYLVLQVAIAIFLLREHGGQTPDGEGLHAHSEDHPDYGENVLSNGEG